MSNHRRPSRRDWLAGSALGIAVGTVILGIGGRVAMRGIALSSGAPPAFSVGGTTTVVLLGTLAGLAGALVLLALRFVLPGRPVFRGTVYWAFLVLVSLRGLRPLDAERLRFFGPLVVAYGLALQVGWCRLTRQRRSRTSAPRQAAA